MRSDGRRGGPRVGRPESRHRVLLVLTLFVMSLFLGRLVQLQGLDAPALAARAVSNRTVEVAVHAARGDITDADGVVLATSAQSRDIVVDQVVVAQYAGSPDAAGASPSQAARGGAAGAARVLAPLLDQPVVQVRESLTGDSRFAYVAKGVTPRAWRAVDDLDVPGVYSERTSTRLYPAGPVAGNLVGFVGSDGAPLAGLEMTRDDVLSGTDGSRRYERGAQGQRIPTGAAASVEPVPGGDVRLTIQRDLQWYAQRAISEQVAATKAQWGSVIVLDVDSGDILALAEAPTVDPRRPGASASEDRGSRALSDVVEPGSTAKVITAAAALEEGVVAPNDRFVIRDRYTTENGQTFKDSHDHEPEKLTFAGILGESSNTGTVEVGSRMDRETRYAYLQRFGMGRPTGLGFPGEASGILHPADAWDGRTRYAVLFGQGFSLNLLQAAQVYATIGKGGVRMAPRLVAGTTGPDGDVTEAPPAQGTRVVSESTADQVLSMLEGATSEEGTGSNAAIPGYRVAGKTGTAQAPSDGGYSGYTTSFIGLAPADDPELVVAVTLQRPQTGRYGGALAAPVFADVMAQALQQQRIPPTGTTPDFVPLTWD